MIKIIFIALLLFPSILLGQLKKKKDYWPKPIKDSTWIRIDRDTTWGTVEIKIGEGVLKSVGIVVDRQFWTCSQSIYSEKDQKYIDSVNRSREVWFANGSCYSDGKHRKDAFIKTKDGFKLVEGEFIFKPD